MVYTVKCEGGREADTLKPELASRACDLMGDVPVRLTVKPGRSPGKYILLGVEV
jgi:hypothetical protein